MLIFPLVFWGTATGFALSYLLPVWVATAVCIFCMGVFLRFCFGNARFNGNETTIIRVNFQALAFGMFLGAAAQQLFF